MTINVGLKKRSKDYNAGLEEFFNRLPAPPPDELAMQHLPSMCSKTGTLRLSGSSAETVDMISEVVGLGEEKALAMYRSWVMEGRHISNELLKLAEEHDR